MSPAGCGTLAAFRQDGQKGPVLTPPAPGCQDAPFTRQDRSVGGGESYLVLYAEPRSDVRTQREAFFNILLELLEFNLHHFILDGLDGCLHFDKVPDPFSD
jgi:hypothetical protein